MRLVKHDNRLSSVSILPVSGIERRDDPLIGAGMVQAVAGRGAAEGRQDDLGQVPEVEGAGAGARTPGSACLACALEARTLHRATPHKATRTVPVLPSQ
jgi:hypothetical protein